MKLCQCQGEVLSSSAVSSLVRHVDECQKMGATPVSARLLLKYSSPAPFIYSLFVSLFFSFPSVYFFLFFSFVSSQTSAQFSFKKEITSVLQSYSFLFPFCAIPFILRIGKNPIDRLRLF